MIAKTPEEVARLRECGRRHAAILRELIALVAPGVSTGEIEERARELINAGGDEAVFLGYKPRGARRPYPAATCISINDCVVHGIPNEELYIIQDGDIVSIDIGVKHDGVLTDGALTTIAGEADPEDRKMLRAAEEALERGISAARAGATTGDIGHAIQEVADRGGYGYPLELGGHGLGHSLHEEPSYGNYGPPGTGDILRVGEVIAIEPMFTRGSGRVKLSRDGYSYKTRDGSRAVHVEHTVLIGENGAEILTK